MTSAQFGRKLFLALTFSDLVQRLHEVTSRQIGEKCPSAISLVPKLGTSLIEGIYKIKMRILACGQTGHWWSNEKISEQRNIGEIFYAYTNWQAVQTCTGLLIFCKITFGCFAKITYWGNIPQSPSNTILRWRLLAPSERFPTATSGQLGQKRKYKFWRITSTQFAPK